MTRAGRPVLGHVGHAGGAKACEACRLRAWRVAQGLTQHQLAVLVYHGRRQVQRWERGAAPVPGLVLDIVRRDQC